MAIPPHEQPKDPKPLKKFQLGSNTSPQKPAKVPSSKTQTAKPKEAPQARREVSRSSDSQTAHNSGYRNQNVYGSDGQPRKKSLVIGINYVGSQHELEGCHQDVHNIREFLQAV